MEKEMRPMTTEMLKKGYLLFPKALFEEQMNMKTGEKAADAFEAFVFVLTHVNYSTVTCNVRGHLFDCVRGESVLSLARWMEILGWPPQPYALLLQQDVRRRYRGAGGQPLRDAHPYPRL